MLFQQAPKVVEQPKSQSNDFYEKVKEQAELVRTIKANKAAKDEVTKQVNVLLALKEEYKKATGQDWKLIENTQPIVNFLKLKL